MSQSKLTIEQYSLLLLDLKATHMEIFRIKHNIISYAKVKTHIQQSLPTNGTWCQKTDVVRIHKMIHALTINKAIRFTQSKILR